MSPAGNYPAISPGLPGPAAAAVVLATVGAEANAYFYVAWSVASLLVAIPTAIASPLLAEGRGHAGGEIGDHFRHAFRLTLS
jgi:hypothetical protein